MEKTLQKTELAFFADRLLRLLLAAALGMAWFVALWGLSLPALAAGLALGGLFWLCLRQLGKKRMARREQAMRRRIGGELALDRLLLEKPRHRAFQAALWLSSKTPVALERTTQEGVLGTLEGQRVLVRLAARHKSEEASVQTVIDAIQATRAHRAEKCLLCLTAPIGQEAALFAQEHGVTVFPREEMIRLAGLHSPATDQELAGLKRKKPRRKAAGEWVAMVLHPDRAKRYFWYGAGLSALAFVTGQGFYPVPACLCLLLFAGCKLRERREDREA